MKRYDAIESFVRQTVWAILPSKMDAILGFLDVKAGGFTIDAATVERVAANNQVRGQTEVFRSVAVLPVVGVVSQRMNMMTDISGGVSTEMLGAKFDALVKNPDIAAIVLDVDSPGGNYAGTPELARKIFEARGTKPIVAVANSMAASAAYWIASAADEIVVTPSGEVGSIGVLAVHEDQSVANETAGVRRTYITSAEHKAEFNPDEPLSDAGREELQRRVDEAGRVFVSAVEEYRHARKGSVEKHFGQGRMFSAEEAVSRGMADQVGTLEATINRLAGVKRPRGGRRVEIERQRLALRKFPTHP